MDSITCFRLAAFIAGFASFLVAAIWQFSGMNQSERVEDICIGASGACLSLAILFVFLSLVIKP